MAHILLTKGEAVDAMYVNQGGRSIEMPIMCIEDIVD